MNTALSLLAIQIVLGAFDNLWHHEIVERLPRKRSARLEVLLHAIREFLYAAFFVGIAWYAWHGAWAWLVAGVIVVEIAVTLADFVVEDTTRKLPRLERITHTVLAINLGAFMALFAPELLEWAAQPTALAPVNYGAWSWVLTAAAAGVALFGIRDALAAIRHYRRPSWQRRGLQVGIKHQPKRVLISGATGFIGRRLVERLLKRGDRVLVLTRREEQARELFGPYVQTCVDLRDVADAEPIHAIVNLAGAPIAARPWTKRRKRMLLGSRLEVTSRLLELLERLEAKPATWINASAVGYYGVRNDDEPLHEKSPPSAIFQSRLCRAWEEHAARAEAHGVKVARLRIGLVLGRHGGALPALARPVRFGLGTRLGNGQQWVSWIHVDDLVELMLFVLDQATLAGPINATAPEPVRHAAFMQTLAVHAGRRLLPVALPGRLLRAVLGEMAQLFVDGQRVVPSRAEALGFRFRYPALDPALEDLFAVDRGCGESAAAAGGLE